MKEVANGRSHHAGRLNCQRSFEAGQNVYNHKRLNDPELNHRRPLALTAKRNWEHQRRMASVMGLAKWLILRKSSLVISNPSDCHSQAVTSYVPHGTRT